MDDWYDHHDGSTEYYPALRSTYTFSTPTDESLSDIQTKPFFCTKESSFVLPSLPPPSLHTPSIINSAHSHGVVLLSSPPTGVVSLSSPLAMESQNSHAMTSLKSLSLSLPPLPSLPSLECPPPTSTNGRNITPEAVTHLAARGIVVSRATTTAPTIITPATTTTTAVAATTAATAAAPKKIMQHPLLQVVKRLREAIPLLERASHLIASAEVKKPNTLDENAVIIAKQSSEALARLIRRMEIKADLQAIEMECLISTEGELNEIGIITPHDIGAKSIVNTSESILTKYIVNYVTDERTEKELCEETILTPSLLSPSLFWMSDDDSLEKVAMPHSKEEITFGLRSIAERNKRHSALLMNNLRQHGRSMVDDAIALPALEECRTIISTPMTQHTAMTKHTDITFSAALDTDLSSSSIVSECILDVSMSGVIPVFTTPSEPCYEPSSSDYSSSINGVFSISPTSINNSDVTLESSSLTSEAGVFNEDDITVVSTGYVPAINPPKEEYVSLPLLEYTTPSQSEDGAAVTTIPSESSLLWPILPSISDGTHESELHSVSDGTHESALHSVSQQSAIEKALHQARVIARQRGPRLCKAKLLSKKTVLSTKTIKTCDIPDGDEKRIPAHVGTAIRVHGSRDVFIDQRTLREQRRQGRPPQASIGEGDSALIAVKSAFGTPTTGRRKAYLQEVSHLISCPNDPARVKWWENVTNQTNFHIQDDYMKTHKRTHNIQVMCMRPNHMNPYYTVAEKKAAKDMANYVGRFMAYFRGGEEALYQYMRLERGPKGEQKFQKNCICRAVRAQRAPNASKTKLYFCPYRGLDMMRKEHCLSPFVGLRKVQEHIKTEHSEKKFICFCLYKNNELLTDNAIESVGDSKDSKCIPETRIVTKDNPIEKGRECKKQFLDWNKFKTHVKIAHPQYEACRHCGENASAAFRCMVSVDDGVRCIFYLKSQIVHHINTEHALSKILISTKETKRIAKVANRDDITIRVDGPKKQVCGKKRNRGEVVDKPHEALNLIVQDHDKGDGDILRKHRKVKHIIRCTFPECGRIFTTDVQKQQHDKLHTKNPARPFVCPFCLVNFRDLESIRDHKAKCPKSTKHSGRIVADDDN